MSCCHRDPCPSQLLTRLQPFNRGSSCQCSRFLCVPVAGCPVLGHGAAGQRVWSSCPGPIPLVWPDDGMVQKQMVMLGLSWSLQRWHGDGTEVFRLAAPRQASPWTASLCNYHPSRGSCNSYSTSENVQQNTGQASWQTAHRFYLKEDEHAFSKHISKRRYTAYAFNVKNNSKSRTKQIHEERENTCLVPTGIYLGMSLIVNLRWQRRTPEFPSYRDNLNDNVICHFVHKVIYPLS